MENKIKDIFIRGPIDPAFIAESIRKHSVKKDIGAHSIFLGQVRADEINNKTTRAILYSAYEDMALEKMHQIREDVFRTYNLTCMHVYHSLGIVQTGEICLFVFTSSSHRADAIRASEELVERIKKELPVWGKEIFEDETYQWKTNK